MADTPQQGPSGDGASAADAEPQTALSTRPLIERGEVVWLVAWIALGMILLGLVSTLGIWSASSSDVVSQPPRFLTDINSAPAAELALLPGIGPELAERIIAERQVGGPFTSAEQLARVRGIGPKTIEHVTPLVICGEHSAEGPFAATAASAQPAAVERSAGMLKEPVRPAPAHAESPSPAAVAVE